MELATHLQPVGLSLEDTQFLYVTNGAKRSVGLEPIVARLVSHSRLTTQLATIEQV